MRVRRFAVPWLPTRWMSQACAGVAEKRRRAPTSKHWRAASAAVVLLNAAPALRDTPVTALPAAEIASASMAIFGSVVLMTKHVAAVMQAQGRSFIQPPLENPYLAAEKEAAAVKAAAAEKAAAAASIAAPSPRYQGNRALRPQSTKPVPAPVSPSA